MRIKQYFTRKQLEDMAMGRIRRTFGIPRQVHFTKTQLINKVWLKIKKQYAPERKDLEDMTMGELRHKYRLPYEKGLTKEKVINMAVEGDLDDRANELDNSENLPQQQQT